MDQDTLILGIIYAYIVINHERFNTKDVEEARSEFFHIAAEIDTHLTEVVNNGYMDKII
jgi:hypothetical protein